MVAATAWIAATIPVLAGDSIDRRARDDDIGRVDGRGGLAGMDVAGKSQESLAHRQLVAGGSVVVRKPVGIDDRATHTNPLPYARSGEDARAVIVLAMPRQDKWWAHGMLLRHFS